ncbi:hypothetical protein LK12_00920 [Novosphingobium malaysiense]|uniref:Uncharacterized protein n=1 Tax=Novosphingobium malaysiense TaxID=1348853 RepID=A0A0B1ZP95_9SPHN|nr:hypothetical protein LK12_00920 [Novosphingobium malaysiense]
MDKRYLLAFAVITTLAGPQAEARDDTQDAPKQPAIVRQLMECRIEPDAGKRLACYDKQTAALDEATRSKEIVIADKEAVDNARRGLFGFAAPIGRLMGFGGNDDDKEELEAIDTTVTGVRRTANGWRLSLENGSIWEQNDTRDFVLSPKVGNDVHIKRGALGTYLVSVQGQRSIKMRRIE